ncbi:hypothetical protein FGU71_03515 [Erythrobacter insulae]|uniref:Uncharacterized protein n=1 Tax=Erythrobacter insulae TaxID=2584124 RepID=A0A547PA35_9SPHN|nr:hypothetical protein [Erythrobacter insulae]TRD11010.1 hypothetical protein FGU71_03515 [Erythrobacter insulae]
MIMTLISSALLTLSAQASVSDISQKSSALSQQSKAVVRCSAAFALVSFGQGNGNEDALKWPKLEPRGREFFVRSLARLMDETGLDQAGIADLVGKEAQNLWDNDKVNDVMPGCLVMLEASGV